MVADRAVWTCINSRAADNKTNKHLSMLNDPSPPTRKGYFSPPPLYLFFISHLPSVDAGPHAWCNVYRRGLLPPYLWSRGNMTNAGDIIRVGGDSVRSLGTLDLVDEFVHFTQMGIPQCCVGHSTSAPNPVQSPSFPVPKCTTRGSFSTTKDHAVTVCPPPP